MLADVRYAVLGPLTVTAEGSPVVLGGPKQRLVLALLLIRPGGVLTPDRLIDGIWGDEPPDRARHTLQAYVSELRGVLDESIEWTGHGYRLTFESDQVDSVRFEDLLEKAREDLSDDPYRASEILIEGLGLWRGEPFADLNDAIALRSEVERLQQLRVAAIEERIDADLALGRHQTLVEELDTLTREHPYRERFRAQHMLALYRSGRQTDALRAFAKTRELLVEELGIDPSPELQTLEEQILRQDPALEAPRTARSGDEPFGRAVRGIELRDVIGRGDSTVVYRAYQPSLAREVAVKVIGAEVADRPEFIRRFEENARAVARLEHPHILGLHDFWREPSGAFMVMALAQGGSLAQRTSDGDWSPAATLRVIEEVGSALAYAHRRGIAHGAVTLSNVLLDDEDNAYLADFAVAGEAANNADDIYALGKMIGGLLGGSPPDNITRGLDRVLDRAMARDPTDCYPRVEDLLRDLRRVFGVDVVRTASDIDIGSEEVENPYRGLRAFLEGDADLFFGRDDLIERLIETVREHPLVAVVGPSGCGKSSLVRAGMMPAIRAGAIEGSDMWLITDMFPGPFPFEELTRALNRVAVVPVDLDDLMSDKRGLFRITKQVLPGEDVQLLLLIDQFEELFSTVHDPETRRLFLDSLTVATSDAEGRLHVVITLRADYFDRPLEFHGFGSRVEAGLVPVAVPSEDGLAVAISQPARMAGLELEPGLVARIVADVKDEPGGLPLMQHALTELANRHRNRLLTFEAYHETGGVDAALGKRAEEVFAALSQRERAAAEYVFLRLVSVDETTDDTRRRVRRTELVALDIEATTLDNVIQRFGAHRLLTFDRDPVTRGATVEIAHEALLREWDRLRGWVNSRREDLLLHRRLVRAVQEWEASGRDDAFLLTGGRLEQFETWGRTTDFSLTESERDFLVAGRLSADAISNRRRWRRGALVGVLSLLTVAAVWLAVNSLDQARNTAARSLVAAARGTMATDPELALLLAVEGVENARAIGGSVLDDATASLHEALLTGPVTRSLPGVGRIAWSHATNLIATLDNEGGITVSVRDATSGDVVSQLVPGHGNVSGLAWSSDGRLLAITHREGPAILWEPARDQVIAEIPPDLAGYSFPSFGPGDEILAMSDLPGAERCCRTDSVLIWDVAANAELHRFGLDTRVFGTHMSPVEPLLVVSEPETFRAAIWDVQSGEKTVDLGSLGYHNDFVRFSPDGQKAAVLGAEQLEIFDVGTGESILKVAAGRGNLDLEWTPDGRYIATSGNDVAIRIFDAAEGTLVRVLESPFGGIPDIEFGPRGFELAGVRDEIRVWEPGDNGGRSVQLYRIGHPITNAVWTPNRDRVVTIGTADGVTVVDIIDVATGMQIASIAQPVFEDPPPGPLPPPDKVLVSPDGRFIAATQHGVTTQIIDAETYETVTVLDPGGSPGSFSPDSGLLIVGDFRVAYIYDTDSWAEVGRIRNRDPSPHFTWYDDSAFHPTRPIVFVADANETDRGLTVWDISGKPERIATFRFEDGTHAVSLSADGRRVAVRSVFSGFVRVWDVDVALAGSDPSTAILLDIEPGDVMYGAVLNDDGTVLATANKAGELAIWDVDRSERKYTIDFGEALEQEPQFSSHRLLVPLASGTIHELTLDLDELLDIARARAPRSLTEQECRIYLGGDCPSAP